jgi:hypothetical protein
MTQAVAWYHHYLQHPGHSRLKETMRSMMYWKGMRNTIWRYIKSCRSCQANKRHSLRYGHVPPKLVITTPWRALCEDLVGSYTLKGRNGSSIDFMCLTMIDPATRWFEIVELTTVRVTGRHGFILCGAESTKIISTQYKSYGLIDLYQFLHI